MRARLLTAMRLEPGLVRKIGVARRRDKPATPALTAFHDGLEQLRLSLAR